MIPGNQLRAFTRLSVMSGKDMMRNKLSGVSMVAMFAILLVLYVTMWLAFATVGPAPVVSVTPANQQVTQALRQAGVTIVEPGSKAQNGLVEVSAGSALATFDTNTKPAWDPVWMGLRDAGYPSTSITVVTEEGEERPDLLRLNLGIIAMGGIAGIAFIGTTVPLVGMRERGLLRLLGTTPLRRTTLLLAQIPSRLIMATLVSVVVIGVALWRKYLDEIDLLNLAITLAIGSTMLLGIALVFAARARREEASQSGMAMLTIMLVFAAGGIVPANMLPGIGEVLMNLLPTTWFASALGANLSGITPFLPVPVLWALMGAATCIAFVLATRLFNWDQAASVQRVRALRSTPHTRKVAP